MIFNINIVLHFKQRSRDSKTIQYLYFCCQCFYYEFQTKKLQLV
jgi:hypothetical protein